MSAELEESYRLCRRIARRAASNFCFSFYVLPPDERRAMFALYAFLRQTDDLCDDVESSAARSDEPGERAERLRHWRDRLDGALAGRDADEIFPAVADAVHRFRIPAMYLHQVIDGCAMDLAPRRYATFQELENYCHHVASAVGQACIHIWGFQGPQAHGPADDCGVAFQLTNILRDLAEDARRGRVYLPEEDLDRFGYTARDLSAGVVDDRFRRLVDFEVERAESYFRRAENLTELLSPRGRRVYGAMVETYSRLLAKIRLHRDELLSRRIRLSRWQKLRIATNWLSPWAVASSAGRHGRS